MKEYYECYKEHDVWRVVHTKEGYISYFVVIRGREYEFDNIVHLHKAVTWSIIQERTR